jgi:hypothetical protein
VYQRKVAEKTYKNNSEGRRKMRMPRFMRFAWLQDAENDKTVKYEQKEAKSK